jgi:hypothetical protein
VTQLSRRNEAVAILVKVPQPLDEVLGSVTAPVLADCLIDRQENFKADPVICTKQTSLRVKILSSLTRKLI